MELMSDSVGDVRSRGAGVSLQYTPVPCARGQKTTVARREDVGWVGKKKTGGGDT